MARWLLMCHDRLEGDTLAHTHKFLAQTLGAYKSWRIVPRPLSSPKRWRPACARVGARVRLWKCCAQGITWFALGRTSAFGVDRFC